MEEMIKMMEEIMKAECGQIGVTIEELALEARKERGNEKDVGGGQSGNRKKNRRVRKKSRKLRKKRKRQVM